MENKPKKPLSMKHLWIAAGVSTAVAMGVSIGVTAAIVGNQDKMPTYIVTFVNDDDTVLATTRVKIGGTATFSGKPSKSNPEQYIDYTFTGWDKPLTNILANTTVKAQYSAQHQTFTTIWLNEDGSEWGRDENCDKYEMSKGNVPTCSKGLPTKPTTAGTQYIFSQWKHIDEGWKTGEWTAQATFDSAPENMLIENGVVVEYTGTSTSVEIPKQWSGQPVTTIGAGAFKKATAVQSVVIPNTITKIGSNAFDGMSALKTVAFEEGTKITEIPEYAFNNCIGLTEFTVPNSVTTLRDYAFAGCSNMATINLGSGVKDIDDTKGIGTKTFTGCTSLKNVTAIGNEYFHTVDGVEGVVFGADPIFGSILVKCMPGVETVDGSKLPEDLWLITSGAFESSKINSIDLSKCRVTVIGNGAFANSKITSFNTGDSLTLFGDKVFENCDSLTSITLGKSVLQDGISTSTFTGCVNLANINVDSANEQLASDNGCLYTKDFSELLRCPPKKTAPELHTSCTILGESCFEKCSEITSYTVPDSIIQIKSTAFSKCPNLIDITWGNSEKLTTLGKRIFQDCDKLTTINIGKGIAFSASFDAEALAGCKNLTTITVDAGSQTLEAVNGVLYTKLYNNQKWIVKCPAAKTDIETFTIPSDVTHIANSSFDSCKQIKKIVLPASIADIYDYAFRDCTSLETIELSEGYSYKGSATQIRQCFTGSTNFKNVIIHIIDGYTKDILSYFYNQKPDKSTKLDVELNLQVSEIAGENCQYITTVDKLTIDSGVTAIKDYAFKSCQFTNIVLPDTIETIGFHAFEGNNKLTTINIPPSLKTINQGAFGSCSAIQTLDLSSSNIETIEKYAFGSCGGLTEIKLPVSLTKLEDYSFTNCILLSDVYYAGTAAEFKTLTKSNPVGPFIGLTNLLYVQCKDEKIWLS